MLSQTFGKLKDEHRLAIFKRCITLIGGKKAVYLRLPSSVHEAEIMRFADDNVAEDWLMEQHKVPYLSEHMRKVESKFPGYDQAVVDEMAWIKPLMDTTPDPNAKSRSAIKVGLEGESRPAIGAFNVIPEGTEPTQPTQPGVERVRPDPDGSYRFAVPKTGNSSCIRSRFVLPDDKRTSLPHKPFVEAELLASMTEDEQLRWAITESQSSRAREESSEALMNMDGSISKSGCAASSGAVPLVRVKQEFGDQLVEALRVSAEHAGMCKPICIEDSPPKKAKFVTLLPPSQRELIDLDDVSTGEF